MISSRKWLWCLVKLGLTVSFHLLETPSGEQGTKKKSDQELENVSAPE